MSAAPAKTADELREEVGKRQRELEDTLEAERGETKRLKSAMDGIADDYMCPITQELPVDPVMAEDGKVYERSAIEQWLSKPDQQRSPSTGAAMGSKLLPASQVKNTIETLVKSGAIDGAKAMAWRTKLENEKIIADIRAKAEKGDKDAMYQLGSGYDGGLRGLAVNKAEARKWFERGAKARDPRGMGAFGECLVLGIGGPAIPALGLVWASQAAALGSQGGAMLLGAAFLRGKWGVPTDKEQAKFWLRKLVNEACVFDNEVTGASLELAAKWLEEAEA
mmetsp:Transcript_14067/g.41924  ORF Transcript_14067/g.41924 Transcript_14067/m.41924 type:complete len:279 (+) Transcript_14067:286-1122(+)